MSKSLSTKTLLASSAIAFGLLVALGSAQAQKSTDELAPPTAGTSRQIEVVPGAPAGESQQQPETELRANAPAGAPTDGPADAPADARADGPDGAPQDATSANAAPDGPQDAAPVGALQQPIESAPTTTATAPTVVEPKSTLSDETKRKNRERYIERYESRQYVEPRNKHQYEPRYKERYVEPRYVEPRYAEPRYVAPKPRYVEPRYVEPRYVEPRYYEPRREYYGSRGGY